MNPLSNLPSQPVVTAPSPAPKKGATPWLLPWLVFITALLGTYILWSNTKQKTLENLQARFEYNVFEAIGYISQRVASYELVLRGVQGLFASSQNIERHEFREFIQKLNLVQGYPGIQSIGLAETVPPEQKRRHIESIRKQGFPDFTIHPEGERGAYASVIFIEPFNEDNQFAFGLDMLSYLKRPGEEDSAPGLRHAAMEKARDSGKIAISGKIKFVSKKGGDAQTGIMMFLPLYRNNMPIDTLSARRANITGWIFATFRMDELMANVLAEHSNEINVEIYDSEQNSEQSLLYVNNKAHRASNNPKALFRTTRQIDLHGHKWTLSISSMPELEKQLDDAMSFKFIITGIAASLLLMLLTWLGVHDRELALIIAHQASESQIRINHLNKQLSLAIKEMERIMNAFPDLHYMVDLDGKLVRWNSSLEKFLGLSHENLLNRQITDFICQEDRQKALEEINQTMEQDQHSTEIKFVRNDGTLIPFMCNCATITNEENGNKCVLIAGRDISERKATEDQMERLAHFDLLTGLPNRALFSDRLQQALAISKRERGHMALMFVDLDDFKPINDDLGHDIGDQLLQQVAQRLQGCMRESDTAARIGGDEFLVLLPHIEMPQDAKVVSEKIRLALYQPFNVGGETLRISSSIGISIYPEHGAEERVLVKNADIAMYHAKKLGRNNVQLYRPGMQEAGG